MGHHATYTTPAVTYLPAPTHKLPFASTFKKLSYAIAISHRCCTPCCSTKFNVASDEQRSYENNCSRHINLSLEPCNVGDGLIVQNTDVDLWWTSSYQPSGCTWGTSFLLGNFHEIQHVFGAEFQSQQITLHTKKPHKQQHVLHRTISGSCLKYLR